MKGSKIPQIKRRPHVIVENDRFVNQFRVGQPLVPNCVNYIQARNNYWAFHVPSIDFQYYPMEYPSVFFTVPQMMPLLVPELQVPQQALHQPQMLMPQYYTPWYPNQQQEFEFYTTNNIENRIQYIAIERTPITITNIAEISENGPTQESLQRESTQGITEIKQIGLMEQSSVTQFIEENFHKDKEDCSQVLSNITSITQESLETYECKIITEEDIILKSKELSRNLLEEAFTEEMYNLNERSTEILTGQKVPK